MAGEDLTMDMALRTWSREDFERLSQSGIIPESERVELIGGQIVNMSPIDPLHAFTVDFVNMLLVAEFGKSHLVRVQNPILAREDSQPQPDLMLIPLGSALELRRQRQHPDRADLLVEVSNTSLAYDRGVKGSLFASAGQPCYWIINLIHNQLEVYTNPAPDAGARFGSSYATFHTYGPGQTVEFGGKTLAVNDLLPPPEEGA